MATKNLSLTPRQAEIIGFVRRFVMEHGFPPTLREIAAQFGINVNAAARHIAAAAKRGAIRRAPRVARGLSLSPGKRSKPG